MIFEIITTVFLEDCCEIPTRKIVHEIKIEKSKYTLNGSFVLCICYRDTLNNLKIIRYANIPFYSFFDISAE